MIGLILYGPSYVATNIWNITIFYGSSCMIYVGLIISCSDDNSQSFLSTTIQMIL